MTRYLKSILSLGRTRDYEKGIQNLEKQVASLKEENEKNLAAIEDLVVCINQVASTTAAVLSAYSTQASQRDPVDDALDEFWKKDSGGGYLN